MGIVILFGRGSIVVGVVWEIWKRPFFGACWLCLYGLCRNRGRDMVVGIRGRACLASTRCLTWRGIRVVLRLMGHASR